MEYKFNRRISGVKPSPIREIIKMVIANPTIIPLSTGNPSMESIPVEQIHEISDEIFKTRGGQALNYGATEGYIPLIETTKKRLKDAYGIGRDFDDVIITTGGQQGLYLPPSVLCNEGDTVIVESPTFVSGIIAMKENGCHVVGVEMDDEGIRIDGLLDAIKNNDNVKMLYLIPTFQNPRGTTMSFARRKEVYDICVKNNIIILEDNPYAELRFDGEEVPPIKSFDEEGIVIYNGSYSKVLSAGMRLGFTCAPKPIMQKLIIGKQGADCHSNLFFQMVTDEFFKKYGWDNHVKLIREVCEHKAKFMLSCLDKYMDKRVTWTKPQGGLFLWCTLPDGLDGYDFSKFACEKGVAVVPGCCFMVDDDAICSAFRLNYSTPSDENIEKGVKILAAAATEYIDSHTK